MIPPICTKKQLPFDTVMKFDDTLQFDHALPMAQHESNVFNTYYGDNASEVIQHNGDVYPRMVKVPGVPLSEIDAPEIPDNLEKLYLELICKMNEMRIIHDDLNTGNILYDKESDSLFPIDFCNIHDEYYAENATGKIRIDNKLQSLMDDVCSLS